jgi:hypothetical protein
VTYKENKSQKDIYPSHLKVCVSERLGRLQMATITIDSVNAIYAGAINGLA